MEEARELKHDLKDLVIPQHIAIIMDGNGRWAKKRGRMRVMGHRAAITAVRDTIEGAAELGVKYLTLYAFSTENWQRPAIEVEALMQLLVSTLRKELKTLQDNNIRLCTIGNTNALPKVCQQELAQVKELTEKNTHMTVTLALNYGARADITEAVQKICSAVKSGDIEPTQVTAEHISQALTTAFLPDPELLIRTSGEYRISNFLLWEIAYTELYISNTLWPDFRRKDLLEAILDFQKRERRFGKTSEQIR